MPGGLAAGRSGRQDISLEETPSGTPRMAAREGVSAQPIVCGVGGRSRAQASDIGDTSDLRLGLPEELSAKVRRGSQEASGEGLGDVLD